MRMGVRGLAPNETENAESKTSRFSIFILPRIKTIALSSAGIVS